MSAFSTRLVCSRLPMIIRCDDQVNTSSHRKSNIVKVKSTLRSYGGLELDHMAAGATTEAEDKRQNIPTEKKYVDRHRHGLMVDNGVGYRQTVVIRSYEVGPDRTATLDSILNLLQETALNHVWMSGLLGNGFGATHGMVKNNLIWVVSRMHVLVDHYPIWGEIVEIDTWVAASGKNGMRRDWVIRSQATGHIYARATSTWVMMNEKTRRLSKMPEVVREEISPWFIDKQAIQQDDVDVAADRIVKLDNGAKYVNTDLKPRRSDLDMNHHVNNVKYVKWMLETIPDNFVESHQLSGIILEYRRECRSSDIVQSLCEPDDNTINLLQNCFRNSDQNSNNSLEILDEFSLASQIMQGNGLLPIPTRFTHLLRTQLPDQKKPNAFEEIVRGKTFWKKRLKPRNMDCNDQS
ncbi:Palmitoyl-acyl carrier protein thioesterase, chloroplastic [Linum grandiflorum]